MIEASPDLKQIVLEALQDAPKDRRLLGSTLGNLAARVAAAHGFVFKHELKRAGLTMKRLLEQMQEIRIRPAAVGPDFEVTTSDGNFQETKSTEGAQQLRKDIYDAFTRLRDEPLFYDPVYDKFHRDGTDESRIIVPPITIDILIDDRQKFAATVADANVSAALERALQTPSVALTNFKNTIDQAGLKPEWYSAVAELVKARIQGWVAQSGLIFREEWLRFEQRSHARDPRQTLNDIAKYMTDQEVRALSIPLRAIEALIVMRGLR